MIAQGMMLEETSLWFTISGTNSFNSPFLVTVAENGESVCWMIENLPRNVRRMPNGLVLMKVCIEDDSSWGDDRHAEVSSLVMYGLSRLAIAVRGNVIRSSFLDSMDKSLEDEDWQNYHAAFTALGLLSKECSMGNSAICFQPRSDSMLHLAVVAADNNQSGSSTSPGSTSSSSESSGSSSDDSDSLFTVRLSPEPDGAVEDQDDERPVSQQERLDGRLKRISIKEIMRDGSKVVLCDVELERCHGYYSFASSLREVYAGDGDDLTEAECNDNIVHVLWPWHHYQTWYMVDDQHELDPRRLAWSKFSGRLREIWVEKEPVGNYEYSVVENNQNAPQQNANMLRIIFREAANVTRPDMVRDINRRKVDNYRSFIWILHAFWASWRMEEPLDPEMVTETNMVLEQSYSLHPPFSIQFFDENNEVIEIPSYLSLNRHELSLEASEARSDSGNEDEPGDDDNVEVFEGGNNNGNEEIGGDESGDENGQVGDMDGKVVDKEDENHDAKVLEHKVNLNREMNGRDEEVVNDEDFKGSEEEDPKTVMNFLQKVTRVVITREGIAY